MANDYAINKLPEFYDYLKHLTTLATGSLVVLLSVAEKFSRGGKLKWLFGVSLASFLGSVFSSVLCMLFVLSTRRQIPGYEDPAQQWIPPVFLTTIGFLLLGAVSLTVFGIANYVRRSDSDQAK